MNVCVLGQWHLGSVTAACLAALGHRVVGLDADAGRIASLSSGAAPLFEAGLEELLRQGLASGRLRFTSTASEATAGADVVWVACDTAVGDDGPLQPHCVTAQVKQLIPALRPGTLVVVSSQLPVGSVRRLQQYAANHSAAELTFACVPENLRLGSAVSDFLRPERVVVGLACEAGGEVLHKLLRSIPAPIEWMSLESAEMTKHAINAFLAVSVTFANELGRICEAVGADGKQVERGLKTDRRIGPGAYLAPGAAFAGGTLARDVGLLNRTAGEHGIVAPLLSAILPSNAAHELWARDTLRALFADLSQTTIAVWGVTYKPGTDTLRGSPVIELCDWLLHAGATIRVHDPIVSALPPHWGAAVERCDSPVAAVRGAHALVLATAWPVYRTIAAGQLLAVAPRLAVLDPQRFLPHLADADAGLRYFAVGMPRKIP